MPGSSALLWLLLPVFATIGAAWYLARRAKANPNADISAGVNELDRFQRALATVKPPAKKDADGNNRPQ
ncbi:MAG: hypothetical protein RIS43_930 [Actinomycetota bacterium]|jgi:hypothetical protein